MRLWLSTAIVIVLSVASALGRADDLKKLRTQLASRDETKAIAALDGLAALERNGVVHIAAALDDTRVAIRLMALRHLAVLGEISLDVLPKLVDHGALLGTAEASTLHRAMFDAATFDGIDRRTNLLSMRREQPGMLDADRREADHLLEANVTTQVIAAVGAFDVAKLFELVAATSRGDAPHDFTVPRVAVAMAMRQRAQKLDESAVSDLRSFVARNMQASELDARLTAHAAASAFADDVEAIESGLLAALRASDARESAFAAAALCRLSPQCERRGEQLRELFADPSAYARIFIAAASRRNCGQSPESELVLLEALNKGDDETRIATIEVLNHMGFRPPPRAVPGLADCLKSRNERLLVLACDTLAVLGSEAVEQHSKIEPLEKHKSFRVRQSALAALERARR